MDNYLWGKFGKGIKFWHWTVKDKRDVLHMIPG